MPSKEFHNLLDKMREIHDKKSHDYASELNPFSNFTRAAELASWFDNPIDQVFASIIGIKLARLAELVNGKIPKNESIDDTGLDLSNYCILWQAYRDSNKLNTAGQLIGVLPFGYKEICSYCKLNNKIKQIIHALEIHRATLDLENGMLKYPNDSTIYLVEPDVLRSYLDTPNAF